MELTVEPLGVRGLRAGYSCPCGCTPSVNYERGGDPAFDRCCCGNRFAVAPRSERALDPSPGFDREVQSFVAPWGDRLEATWDIGASVHDPPSPADPW
jgi:hypothetical protein